MEPRDVACLYKIKSRYGGTVSMVSRANAMRYRLHNRPGMIAVLNDLNGLLLNPIRLAQFTALCQQYNVSFIESSILQFNSAYLAGLFDSDGSVYLNVVSQQVFITISQKNRVLLDVIAQTYGGKVYSANSAKTAFK